jgi:hypothetical protein
MFGISREIFGKTIYTSLIDVYWGIVLKPSHTFLVASKLRQADFPEMARYSAVYSRVFENRDDLTRGICCKERSDHKHALAGSHSNEVGLLIVSISDARSRVHRTNDRSNDHII